MIKTGKKNLIAEFDFNTLAPSLNNLYSASTWKMVKDKRSGVMMRKKIKGQSKDADDYKKEYREMINNMKCLNGVEINERVYLVWTPYTNNRKTGHYDNINFCSNYKMIVDVLVTLKVFKNDDYRYISQDILNHPIITEKEHFINLKIYKSDPL